MIFTPYRQEAEIINMISQIRSNDYALLRLTPTMIEKNNLDANGIFRELLFNEGIVDYEELDFGGTNGVSANAKFIQNGKTDLVKLKFYKVTNNRGDRRFSIETIKKRMRDKEINEGDLLYISIYKDKDKQAQIFMVNLTHNVPTKDEIVAEIGSDEIAILLETIKPKIKEILIGGFYNNSKGIGSAAPKDMGDTLEHLLGIDTNNRDDADFGGLIEVKSKGESRTLDTLFTLRPCFEGTPVAEFEHNDRNRVSAFARYYGYESEKHPDCSSLYITIGSQDMPQNNQGFYLDVDENEGKVFLKHIDENKKSEIAAFWTFADLRGALNKKHPSTLWFKAEKRTEGEMVQFKYNEVEFSRSPQFVTFLSLIKKGIVTYDWRGYTTKQGKYSGKNHGNAWRIKPEHRAELFGTVEQISF